MALTFDVVDLTDFSESSPRAAAIDTLQWHHTAYPSDAGSRGLMDAGGRTVSANGLLLQGAGLMLVVPTERRAFTSGVPSQDHRAFTVETVNQTAGPEWVISDAQHRRMAFLLYQMNVEFGVPMRHGQPGILQHFEVPGTYATACAGPSASTDRVTAAAVQLANPITKEIVGMSDLVYVSLDASLALDRKHHYALISPSSIEGGVKESVTLSTGDAAYLAAQAMSIHSLSSGFGAPFKCASQAQYDAVLALAAARAATYKKLHGATLAGDVTFPGSLELGPKSLEALAKIETATKKLNPAD